MKIQRGERVLRLRDSNGVERRGVLKKPKERKRSALKMRGGVLTEDHEGPGLHVEVA